MPVPVELEDSSVVAALVVKAPPYLSVIWVLGPLGNPWSITSKDALSKMSELLLMRKADLKAFVMLNLRHLKMPKRPC